MNAKYKIKQELSKKEEAEEGTKKNEFKIIFCFVNRDFENLYRYLNISNFAKKKYSRKKLP